MQASAETTLDPRAQTAFNVVRHYAQALATSDPVRVTQSDFVCLLKMVQEQSLVDGRFAPPTDPAYPWCWNRLTTTHARVVSQHDHALDELWPGKGQLVNFADFQRFLIAETGARQLPPSVFVMDHIGSTTGSLGFDLEFLGTAPLPHASFRIHKDDEVVAVPTTLVRTRVVYPDPIQAPVANAPGEKDWAVPYKKPVRPVKAVTVKWVVLSGLAQLGFPTDLAVLNIPLQTEQGTPIPFVIEPGGYSPKSTEWWEPDGLSEVLDAAIIRANALPDRQERITLLNRVLAIHPTHQFAIESLSHELFDSLLTYGQRLHGINVSNPQLAQRLDELYWTVQSQTDRMDLSLGMEMGGKAEPTPADFLYRMIPVMETLRTLQPGDFENRLRLSLAYRWTNDQITAILTPQKLLTEVPADQDQLHARILLELAWSRISKVAWNRHFDDPDIMKGYEEAAQAFSLTTNPIDKFTAAYAQAYSLAFRPNRDNQAMLDLFTQARHWFQQIPGANQQSWEYLLQNDTLKGLVETDPAFQSLLTAT
ncbi:MAG: hypothetical protein GKS05_00430 [Nitrospirales bacterium]|nr:hypothetical protein [Nitrospirales bacterium]